MPGRTTALAACFAALALAANARAEGNAGRPRRAGDANRVYGADFIKPVAGGLATVGGSTLRWLPPGANAWVTLLTVNGHLSRLGIDDAGGRIMAVWEEDPTLHLLRVQDGRHDTFPLPPLALPGAQITYVHGMSFTPDGNSALVWITGPTRGGPRFQVSRAYRQELGGQRSLTQLWDQDDTGDLIWTCGRGALYILPSDPSRKGRWQASLTGGLVAFDLDGGELKKRTIFYDPNNKFRSIQIVSGSSPDRIVGIVTTGRGGYGMLQYRWGEAQARYQPLPPGPGPSGGAVLSQDADEILYHIDRGRELEIVRMTLSRPPLTRSVPLWSPRIPVRVRGGARTLGSHVLGRGYRADGSVWYQLGDDLALIDSAGTVRRVDLVKLIGFKPEWAGAAVYVEQPESLWLGIEIGAGRDWIRFGFDVLNGAARPWPGRESIPPVSAEQIDDHERMTKCLPPDARIATPDGDVEVSRLTIGMPVWTMNTHGDRVAGTVLRTGNSPAPQGHRMVRIVLADGRTLSVSPGHPLPDGRTAKSWLTETRVDGAAIRTAVTLTYAGTETFDLLPSGDTGLYWANGIPLGSTLARCYDQPQP